MKKKYISLYCIIVFVFCQVFGFGSAVFADAKESILANTENFYFEDFTADYYLSKDSDGVSRLRVVENLTAVFPAFNQNKGICRFIPFKNQDGLNVTLDYLNWRNIKISRNGNYEPIYSIEKQDDFFQVCTGDDDYVLGKQVYTIEYEFVRVVTDFSDHQELYANTNGNGWSQKFNTLTARVHFSDDILDDVTGEAWCYVGKYGESGQDRCEISRTSDGFSFTTKNLRGNENLTFDIEISPGTFVVPAPKKSYIYIYFIIAVAISCCAVLVYIVRAYLKSREKEKFYEGLFIKPEYQPHDRYSLEEMGALYIGKKKDIKIAMLLELITKKKIDLIRDGNRLKSRKWSILVNSLDEVSPAEVKLLMILNGGDSVRVGDIINIKTRTATSRLVKLGAELVDDITGELKNDGLVEGDYKVGVNYSMPAAIMIAVFGYFIVSAFLVFMAVVAILNIFGFDEFVGEFVGKEKFFILAPVMLLGTSLVSAILSTKINKVKNHTIEGLKMSRYMDGLKLYIKMAEKERLEFLQSVNNVEVFPEGVVGIYEKLLPYAAVFGLEESWLKEMSQYCKVNEISEPSYLVTGVAAADLSRTTRSIIGKSNSSIVIASGGSGFSGGGGSGFSGGGFGGGGGCGR